MKKHISILLCFVICLSFITIVSANEEEFINRENYGYILYERENSNYYTQLSEPVSLFSSETLPSSYDSRDYGYVSSVKSQGAGNTCWTFAALGALESYLLKSDFTPKDGTGKPISQEIYNFSENHMQYMGSSWNNNPLGFDIPPGGNKYDENNKLIPSGGNSYFATTYFLNDYGPVDESQDPYVNIDYRDYSATKNAPKCEYKVDSVEYIPSISVPTEEDFENFPIYDGKVMELGAKINNLKAQLEEYDPVPKVGDENYEEYSNLITEINTAIYEYNENYSLASEIYNKAYWHQHYLNEMKKYIKNYGSVVCGVYYATNFMDSNKYNLYSNVNGVNHQVLIVGWDDNYPKENFKNQPNDNGAFIVKNSHGTWNNDGGYFYLSYYDYNVFKDVMAITSVSKRAENELLYNLDPYGHSTAIYYNITNVPVKYGNIFTRKTRNEKLTGFSMYAYGGYTYNISFVDSTDYSYNTGVTIKSDFSPSADGYYTFYLDNPIWVTSENFEIIVTATNSGDMPVQIPIEANISANAGSVQVPVVSKVEYNGENILKVGNYAWQTFEQENFGNFCVKAITQTTDPYLDFELSNFTDANGTEKTTFLKGDTVYIHPAFNGVNIDGKQIICVGYDEKGNTLKALLYGDISMDKKHIFKFGNIPSDFSNYRFYMYVWELDKLKPLIGNIKVGIEK